MPTINQGLSAAHDANLVLERLREAGQTLLSLPSNAPNLGIRVQAFGFVPELVEVCASNKPRNRRPVPAPAAIDRMDRAYAWLSLIPNEKRVIRRIVALRSLVKPASDKHLHSWRDIGARVGASHAACCGWHTAGIDMIVAGLNETPL